MTAADADFGGEQRRFTRVTCNIPVMFQLKRSDVQFGARLADSLRQDAASGSRPRRADEDVWFMASALDLSAAGMKLRFNPVQLDRSLTSSDVEWRDALFRFGAGADKFILNGHFLMVYSRIRGMFVTGVEFDDPSPREQFKIVALYAEYRKMMRG